MTRSDLITCVASSEWVSPPGVRGRLGREDAVAAEGTFLVLRQRLRAGDETAASELHATYADRLRRMIRVPIQRISGAPGMEVFADG